MFRWGIVSTAKIGREQVIPAIQAAENGVVSAIASRDLGKAKALTEQTGAPHAFGSYEELLASGTVDGVYIPLPTSQHIEWAVKAADAGKHVLVEKPLALDAAGIAEVIAARDRNHVFVSEAFMVTYHPQWLKVRELLQSGAIGTLRHVQGAFTYYNVNPGDMRNQVDLGGGALPDIGVYPTVATRFATGSEPRRVQARVDRDDKFGTDIYSSIKADFGSFELSFYVSTQLALRQVMVFHGDQGLIEVESPFNASGYGDQAVALYNRDRSEATRFRFPGINQYRLQVEAFARKASGEDVPCFALEDSVKNQKLIDAIYKAGVSDGWETV